MLRLVFLFFLDKEASIPSKGISSTNAKPTIPSRQSCESTLGTLHKTGSAPSRDSPLMRDWLLQVRRLCFGRRYGCTECGLCETTNINWVRKAARCIRLEPWEFSVRKQYIQFRSRYIPKTKTNPKAEPSNNVTMASDERYPV